MRLAAGTMRAETLLDRTTWLTRVETLEETDGGETAEALGDVC